MKYYIISAEKLEEIVERIKGIPEQQHWLSPMSSDREILAIETLEGILKKEAVDLSDAAIEEKGIEYCNGVTYFDDAFEAVKVETAYKKALKDIRDGK